MNAQKLSILIDTDSFSRALSVENTKAAVVLSFSKVEVLDFIRTPGETESVQLKRIPPFTMVHDRQGNIDAIHIAKEKLSCTVAVNYQDTILDKVSKHLFSGKPITHEVQNQVIFVAVQEALARPYPRISRFEAPPEAHIFVTENPVLLENRLWFETHISSHPLNIVSIEEGVEIIDLFLKHQNRYHLASNWVCNKGLFYWLSFRSKVPHYHVGDAPLDALAKRLTFALMSIDEIGLQYYSGANNDTMDNTIYHFNYFITLVSGIFDSLAIKTNDYLKLNLGNRPERVTLNPRAGKQFLQGVRQERPDLRKLIIEYTPFIKLIYEMREVIVHRELLGNSTFVSGNAYSNEEWRINFFRVPEEVARMLQHCRDRRVKYDFVTEWGQYDWPPGHFIEPFRLTKASARTLIRFTNEYLRLLGFSNFIEDREAQNPRDDFVRQIRGLEVGKLGF
ncbi:MAG TPA: hypothetical protein VF707_00070 [Ardenticatenaceae bacterium]